MTGVFLYLKHAAGLLDRCYEREALLHANSQSNWPARSLAGPEAIDQGVARVLQEPCTGLESVAPHRWKPQSLPEAIDRSRDGQARTSCVPFPIGHAGCVGGYGLFASLRELEAILRIYRDVPADRARARGGAREGVRRPRRLISTTFGSNENGGRSFRRGRRFGRKRASGLVVEWRRRWRRQVL